MAFSGTITDSQSSTVLTMGVNPKGSAATAGEHFNGSIYMARVYKAALTAAQVKQNYESAMIAKRLVSPHVTTNLVKYYDGVQNAGVNTYDSTPTRTTFVDLMGAKNGIISGATWENGALKFDRTASTTNWANLGISNYTNPTLEAVITYNEESATSQRQGILNNAQNGGYILGITENGNPLFRVCINGTWTDVYDANMVLEKGVKYHLAGTYDGSYLKVYVNGEEAGSVAITGTITQSQSNTVLAMGANPYGSTASTGELFNGSIYMARVYKGVLTAAQIRQNYEAAMGAKVYSDVHTGTASGGTCTVCGAQL